MKRTMRATAQRTLASVLTAALVALAAVIGVAAPASAAGPALSVSDAPRAGGTVTVTASGFAAAHPGVYIGLGPAGLPGFYAGSASLTEIVWVAPDNADGTGDAGRTARMNADGSFSVEFATPARSEGASLAVYTSKAHGQGFADPSQNVAQTIEWEASPAVATTTTLSASPASALIEGAEATLTATVAPPAAGTVTFTDGGSTLGSAPVENGVASLATTALAAGSRSLAASFTPADSAAHAGSASAPLAYTVTPKPTEPEPQPEPEAPRVPKLTLSTSSGLDPAGQEITVTGTGYDPAQPIYLTTCSDRPLTEVDFAFISAGCTSGAKLVTSHPTRPSMVPFAADGSFQTTLLVTPRGEATAVYTIADHTAPTDRSQDARAAVSFAAPAPVEPEPQPEPDQPAKPGVTVTPAADLDPARENVLTITGTGFTGPGAASGAYVLFGETSVWSGQGALPSGGWIAQAHVPATAITGGRFTVQLTVPTGALDASRSYHVATSAAHRLSATDRSLDTFAAVTVAQPSQPFVAFPASPNVQPGAVLEIVGGGFAPGDVVTAVANSEPITIGTATADGSGRVSFSWTVPTSFAAGPHTLELSVGGAVAASAPFTVVAAIMPPTAAAPEAPAAPSCLARAVSGATLQWGVKESFRSYITGPIAKGEISGGWSSGSGAYSTENDRGRASFGGSVHYTGHGGLLDVTLSNPRVQITGAHTASVILNVQSRGFNGSADVNATGVVFATLALPAADSAGDSIAWNGAAATLTAAGAEAFAGFYAAGDALDAVSISLPLGAVVPCDGSTDATLAATGGDAPLDTVWLGAGALLIGALAISLARRRRTAA